MVYPIYSIRDVKTGFMTPTTDINDESAIRNFYHSVANSEGILFTFASDFSLYCIGSFDTDSGVLSPITPVHLVDGVHALKALQKDGESHG